MKDPLQRGVKMQLVNKGKMGRISISLYLETAQLR